MDTTLINISLAFVEGFALIISPCILPILPLVLTGSLAGSRARPLGIISGFVIMFTLVTLFSKELVLLTHLTPDAIRNLSYVILILLGVMMLSTTLTDKFNLYTQRLLNVGSSLKSANNPESGYWGGLLFGCLVGIVWTPCAGPILAAVIVQAISQKTTLSSLFVVLSFAIGAGMPMLLIALVGRRFIERFGFFKNHLVLFRKLLGLLIIASVFYLIYSSSITLSYSQSNSASTTSMSLQNGLDHPYAAPKIEGNDAWINSKPLSISDLKGKVVLIDFWTYSCINCIRTLPYLKDWYAKYHDQGFEIIGVHSPEFEFEHNLDNVKNGVLKFGIHYPVALDNQFTTWQNYHNRFWPAHYLINKEGEVVYEHFGEGEYDVTENNIRYLLGINSAVKTPASEERDTEVLTPETYLGYARAHNYAGVEAIVKNTVAEYHEPKTLARDQWALQGKWTINAEKIIAASANASLKLHFSAREVYAVMGAPKPTTIKISVTSTQPSMINGHAGLNGTIDVSNNQLYTILSFKTQSDGVVELTTSSPGLEIYTFTFG